MDSRTLPIRIYEKAEAGLTSRYLTWALIAFGVVLRLARYFKNPTLWFDEAALALNILNHSFLDLMAPLTLKQNAPLGFLWTEKLAVTAFGDSEFAFRFFPLVCGLLSVFLFCQVARQMLSPAAANLALMFFALSDWPVYYSAEAKPYSADLCITLLIVFIGCKFLEAPGSARLTLVFGLVGILSPWLSFASVLVLWGTGLAILWTFWRQHEWAHFRKAVALASLWTLSFSFEYAIFLRLPTTNTNLVEFFAGYDPPAYPPLTLGGLFWYHRMFFYFLEDPGGIEFAGLATLMLIIGATGLWRTRRTFLFLLVFPWIATFVASAAHKYPFVPRLILFLLPSVLLLFGHGLVLLWKRSRELSPYFGLLCCALLIFHPLGRAMQHVSNPRPSKEETKPLIKTLNESFQRGDLVYVYYMMSPTFEYYQHRKMMPNVTSSLNGKAVGGRGGLRPLHHHEDLLALRGKERVWVLLKDKEEELHILGVLDSMGSRLREFKAYEVALYLYDLSKAPEIRPIPEARPPTAPDPG